MSLNGKLVCFTGTLANGTRADAKTQAEAAGAKVGARISGKTDILVTGGGVGAKKIAEAQAKGIEVWDEDTFTTACGGGGGGGGKKKAVKKAAPKRKAAPAKPGGAAAPAKKAKTAPAGNIPVDRGFSEHGNNAAGVSVHQDYNWLGNQVDLKNNANKFYRGQVLVRGDGSAYAWTRWGRVGEKGQSGLVSCGSVADAVKEFKKKFKAKSTCGWKGGDADYPASSKYTVIHEKYSGGQGDKLAAAGMGGDEEEEKIVYSKAEVTGLLASFVNFVTNADMFKEQLASMGVDISKMPLGDIDQRTIDSGMEALLQLQAEHAKKNPNFSTLQDLSGTFYSYIPHAFGRKTPPVVTKDDIQKKKDMLNIIGDVGASVQSQKAKTRSKSKKGKAAVAQPAIVDTKYESLGCKLTSVDKGSDEFAYIRTFTENTQGYRKCEVVDAFSVDDCTNAAAFDKKTKGIGNRKLLWHGTNVAVVAAILKSGLRIMPHSGGRVGSGVYLAAENGKSAGYCTAQGHDGIMFLVEAALGKQKMITSDGMVGWNEKDPVSKTGHNSCLAVGRTEPAPADDLEVTLGGEKVVVPQGKVGPNPAAGSTSSSFSQSEYLVYNEDQVRIRYVLRMKFETTGGSWH